MAPSVRIVLALFTGSMAIAAEGPTDALAIMKKVAANTTAATEARRQYVYKQKVRASMVRSDGQITCKESREYTVVPQEATTDKALVSLSGECRQGKKMVPYSQPAPKNKDGEGDRENIESLVDDLVNAKDTRDGIPRELFPLHDEDLAYYKFSLKGETSLRGRRTYDILFEPIDIKDLCIHVGADNESPCHQWKGEAWIDAEDYQPARIDTETAKGVPWGVRVFLGINIRQLGFSINYQRVAENVWFPATYGTEFRLVVFWGYKRTITLSMENTDFRKTDASSAIHFDPPQP